MSAPHLTATGNPQGPAPLALSPPVNTAVFQKETGTQAFLWPSGFLPCPPPPCLPSPWEISKGKPTPAKLPLAKESHPVPAGAQPLPAPGYQLPATSRPGIHLPPISQLPPKHSAKESNLLQPSPGRPVRQIAASL